MVRHTYEKNNLKIVKNRPFAMGMSGVKSIK
jgi:hypothetical protein